MKVVWTISPLNASGFQWLTFQMFFNDEHSRCFLEDVPGRCFIEGAEEFTKKSIAQSDIWEGIVDDDIPEVDAWSNMADEHLGENDREL